MPLFPDRESAQRLIAELNTLRRDPGHYARSVVQPMRGYYQGPLLQYPGELPLLTQEGVAAAEDCLRALLACPPLPMLEVREGLCRAAEDHLREQSASGATGHAGADGSSLDSRVSRYGQWQGCIGENLDYGNAEPRRIVLALLIDDGLSQRGHRANILHADFHCVGVALGPHPQYRHMSVMDFAGAYT